MSQSPEGSSYRCNYRKELSKITDGIVSLNRPKALLIAATVMKAFKEKKQEKSQSPEGSSYRCNSGLFFVIRNNRLSLQKW